MDTIISILDATTETSMPFNEFVIWRARHYREQKQIVIVCDIKGDLPQIDIPSNVKILRCEKRISTLRSTIKGVINCCLARGDRYAIHLHHVDSGLWSQLAMLGTGFCGKTLFTIHNTFSGYPLHNKVRSYFNSLCAKYVSVVSYSAFSAYPKSLKLLKGDRAFAIQNGVDTERIDSLLDDTPIKKTGKIVFVYVARMVPVKNHNFLLDIIKNTNECVSFEFIGAIAPEIEKRVKEERLSDRVELTGLISRNEVFKRLQEAHFYVSSSILEGLPVSLLEGMYVGLPAIVSNIPQHAEVSSDSEAINLLPLDADLWIRKINQMASLPIKKIIENGQQARLFIRKNFSLEKMHRQYDKVYEEIFQII